MKTIEQIHQEIQAALRAARETYEYRAEGASIEFTNAMLTPMRQVGVSPRRASALSDEKTRRAQKIGMSRIVQFRAAVLLIDSNTQGQAKPISERNPLAV